MLALQPLAKTIFHSPLAFLLFILTAAMAAPEEPTFYLKEGDRVVFYGDSITEQRLYTSFVETFVLTRFPKLQVTFTQSGWGGDRVSGGGGGPIDVRLERDVLAYHPTVLTIMLGMNDAGYRDYDPALFETYSSGYTSILDTVKKAIPDIRFTLIQPSPFDDVTQPPKFEGGYNAVLLRYADFLKTTANERHDTLADFNTPVTDVLQRAKAIDAELSQKIIPDRVHPSPAGHLIMAEALLKSWQAPSLVSRVELSVGQAEPTSTEETMVSDLKFGEQISWRQQDLRLPFPISQDDPVMALTLKASDFQEALNQETLKISGLTKPSYKLTIDGTEIGTFSQNQLTTGINLADWKTPMQRQAMNVQQLANDHTNKHFLRWRKVQVPLLGENSPGLRRWVPPLIAELDAEERETVTREREAAQPISHLYTLVPIAP